jgi:hypothetical protein
MRHGIVFHQLMVSSTASQSSHNLSRVCPCVSRICACIPHLCVYPTSVHVSRICACIPHLCMYPASVRVSHICVCILHLRVSCVHVYPVSACIPLSTRSPNPILYSKRLLAAAIHKKVNIYDIASSSSTPVIGSSTSFTLSSSQARKT